jgi:hypothetical protein
MLRRFFKNGRQPGPHPPPFFFARAVRRIEGRGNDGKILTHAFQGAFEEVALVAEIPVKRAVREPRFPRYGAGGESGVRFALGDAAEGVEQARAGIARRTASGRRLSRLVALGDRAEVGPARPRLPGNRIAAALDAIAVRAATDPLDDFVGHVRRSPGLDV